MPGQPRPAIDEIADERIAIFNEIVSTHQVDELKIRRLQNKLEKLISSANVEPLVRSVFHHELAYLYAYRGMAKEAAACFDEAEDFGLTGVNLSLSKAHALYLCGSIQESSRQAKTHSSSASGDHEIGNLVVLCIQAGLFIMADKILEGLTTVEQPYVHIAAAILERLGCSESDVTERLQVAADVIKVSIKHPLMSYSLIAMEDEGMLYRFVVKADNAELVSLDRAIDRALSDRFDSDNSQLDRFLSIGVKPYTSGADFNIGVAGNVYL